MGSDWWQWANDRFGLSTARQYLLDRRVAKGAWYFGDGATLMLLFGVLVATGAVMTLTYSPSTEEAYESVVHITERQVLGWIVRGLHYWSAGLMVVMLFFHLFRQILVGGYKAPREGTWLVGVFLFFCVLVMAFTGYVLRWDERGIHALRVALHMFYHVPLVGERLVMLVQGGPVMGSTSLTRIYAVHVVFVPLTMLLLVGYHLYLIMLHGVTSPTERRRPVATAEEQKRIYKEDAESEERGETFHPYTTTKSGAMATIVFAGVVVLTLVLGPAPLMPEANLVERSFPAEEWWYWWYSGLIALLPAAIAPTFFVLFPIAVFVLLVALPFLDRTPFRGIRNRPVWVVVVVLLVLAMFYLTDLRRRSPWTGWPDEPPPPVPAGVVISEQAEAGRHLFARHGCNTCHAVAGAGREFAIDLASVRRRMSRDELQRYILNPPRDVAMPSYEGHVSDEDLAALVAFVLAAQTFPWEGR